MSTSTYTDYEATKQSGLMMWTFRMITFWLLTFAVTVLTITSIWSDLGKLPNLFFSLLGNAVAVYMIGGLLSIIIEKATSRKNVHIVGNLLIGLFISNISLVVITTNIAFPLVLNDLQSSILWISWALLFTSLAVGLKQSMVTKILSNRLLLLIIWGLGGAAAGFLMSITISAILIIIGALIEPRYDLYWSAAALTGAITVAISIFGRKERLGKVSGNILAYSKLMTQIGVEESAFLSELAVSGVPRGGYTDTIAARERVEKVLPLTFISLAFTIFFIFSSIGMSSMGYSISVNLFSLFLIIVCGTGTMITVPTVLIILQDYQDWRKMWIGFWGLVRLLTLPKISFTREYVYRMSFVYPGSESRTRKKLLVKQIEQLLVDFNLDNIKIPSDSLEQEKMWLKLYTYKLARNQLDKKDDTSVIKIRALKIFQGFKSPLDDNALDLVTRVHLLLVLEESFNLSTDMLSDITPLIDAFELNDGARDDVEQLCTDQQKTMEDAPSYAIPLSLKLLPVVYAVTLWIVTLFLGGT